MGSKAPRITYRSNGGNPHPNVNNLKPVKKGDKMPPEIIAKAQEKRRKTLEQKRIVKDLLEKFLNRPAENSNKEPILDPETGEPMVLIEVFLHRIVSVIVQVTSNGKNFQTVRDAKDLIDILDKVQTLLGQKTYNLMIGDGVTQEKIDFVKQTLEAIKNKENESNTTNITAETGTVDRPETESL